MKKTPRDWNRRQVLKGLAGSAIAASLPRIARAQVARDPKFLIVVGAAGGASIIDAMLGIKASECNDAENLNTFPDSAIVQLENSPLRAVDFPIGGLGNAIPYNYDSDGLVTQADFLRAHHQDMMVFTHTGTSVNHLVAQKRAVTGNDAWGGRTLQEAVAYTYGEAMPIPNVNMSMGGYIEPGIDPRIPDWAKGQLVTDPMLLFAGMHGSRGIGGAPRLGAIEAARRLRDENLEAFSKFDETFGHGDNIQAWIRMRARMQQIEAGDLITSLNLIPESPSVPLGTYGLGVSDQLSRLTEVFPTITDRFNASEFFDPLDAQAAMAYLLITKGISTSVTFGPSFSLLIGGPQLIPQPPLAFDFSHSDNRSTQAIMWGRLLHALDRLIGLLKTTEYGNGESFWDRTLIYIATEFGRTRNRPTNAESFGTAHHLNNGSLIISPMANGNTVLGGVDKNTTLTYGFNPQTGAPEPGRNMAEAEVFAGIAQCMGLDMSGSGLPDVPCMRRS